MSLAHSDQPLSVLISVIGIPWYYLTSQLSVYYNNNTTQDYCQLLHYHNSNTIVNIATTLYILSFSHIVPSRLVTTEDIEFDTERQETWYKQGIFGSSTCTMNLVVQWNHNDMVGNIGSNHRRYLSNIAQPFIKFGSSEKDSLTAKFNLAPIFLTIW